MKIFLDNTASTPRNPIARDFTFYLDEIKKMGVEFDKLIVICTDGDIRPPYPYQWVAKSIRREGEDDPFEGIGNTPIAAMIELYRCIKGAFNSTDEDEEI